MITLPIIKSNTKTWVKIGYIITIPFIILSFSILFYLLKQVSSDSYYNNELIATSIVLFTLLLAFYFIHSFDVKNIEVDGEITFSQSGFKILQNDKITHYSISNLKSIKIQIVGYAGQQVTGGGAPTGVFGNITTSDGFNQIQGHENRLLFTTEDGRKEQFNFFFKEYEQKATLQRVTSNWEIHGYIKIERLR